MKVIIAVAGNKEEKKFIKNYKFERQNQNKKVLHYKGLTVAELH
jgi:hypothetical protein